MQLWDLRSKRSVHTLSEQYQVLAVAFGEEGDQVYTGGIENSIKASLLSVFCVKVSIRRSEGAHLLMRAQGGRAQPLSG